MKIQRLVLPHNVDFSVRPVGVRGKNQTPYFEAIYTERWPDAPPEVIERSKKLIRAALIAVSAGPDVEVLEAGAQTVSFRVTGPRQTIACIIIAELSAWLTDNGKITRFTRDVYNKILPDSMAEGLTIYAEPRETDQSV